MPTITVNLHPVADPQCPIGLHCREIGAAVRLLAARAGIDVAPPGRPAHGLDASTYALRRDRITHAFGALDPVASPVVPLVMDLDLTPEEWASASPVVLGASVRAAYVGKLADLASVTAVDGAAILGSTRRTWTRHRAAILQVAEAATIRATKARDALPRLAVA